MKLDWDSLTPHLIHDLRALVRKGMTNAQLLERNLAPASDSDSFALITSVIDSQRDLGHLLQRLGQLVEAVKEESNRPIPVDLPTAVLAVKIHEKQALEAASAQLCVADPLPRRGFKGIQAVLQELIENSILYRSPERQLVIQIRAQESRTTFCLEVADNGSGWNPAFAAKLFEPLQRLDARRGGAGLGLTIAKAYVEAAGGSIRAELGDPGASFVIELPLDSHPN